jgi:hypothetical protein
MNGLWTPGVYLQRATAAPAPPPRLTSVTGFVGLAGRGPLNSPQRLENWRQFEAVFGGPTDDHDLGPAVYGFFANGGQVCYVVRVADSLSPDRAPRAARWVARDNRGEVAIEVEAASEGAWANALQLRLSRGQARMTLTRLALDAPAGTDRLELATTVGLRDGEEITLVHATESRTRQERGVAAVLSARAVRLDAPLANALPAGSPVLGAGLDFEVRDLDRFERFEDLSLDPLHPRYVPDRVNGDPGESACLVKLAAGHSILVRVTLAEGAVRQGLEMTEDGAVAFIRQTEGRDPVLPIAVGYFTGYDDNGYFPHGDPVAAGYQGLATLEAVEEIALVALPDLARLTEETADHAQFVTGQRQMLRHCEMLGDRFAILDSPRQAADGDPLSVLMPGYIEQLALSPTAVNGALYFPWLRVAPIEGRRIDRFVPPCGVVAGVFARTDALEGVHRSPANEMLRGVLETQFLVTAGQQALLNPAGINGLRGFAGRGIRVWGARTLARDSLWRYIAVRRTLLAIVREIRHSLRWSVFEPNDRRLRRGIAASLNSYLGGLYQTGVLAGASAEEAYFVQCDAETNPPETLERGEVVARIGFAPLRPMEFIVATIRRGTESVAVALDARASGENR